MKYCDSCGHELSESSNFCSNCGKNFSSNNNISHNDSNNGTVIVCAIVGLLFPIIGAILYYALKKSDIKAAKTANICSWISFLVQLLYFLFFGFTIFRFI